MLKLKFVLQSLLKNKNHNYLHLQISRSEVIDISNALSFYIISAKCHKYLYTYISYESEVRIVFHRRVV